MRPYLTVIKDSFREAKSSSVLWILGIFWTILLLALLPLSLTESRASLLSSRSVRNWTGLLREIKQDAAKEGPSPGKQIWRFAGDKYKAAVTAALEKQNPRLTQKLVSDSVALLNSAIDSSDFYNKEAFVEIPLSGEATELAKKDPTSLSTDDRQYLNRLLLKAAFPFYLGATPNTVVQVGYFGGITPLPLTLKQAEPVVKSLLAVGMVFFLGIAAIFIAILVTASMIPRTFEAGAIDLLLSKPVSRPLLFLSKFFGGCLFILLNISYLIVGIWIIAGLRLHIWEHRLLLCIPLFLLSFSTYYCVSALAGVRWKNAVVSVVVTMVFWAVCASLSFTKWILENFALDSSRVAKVVPLEDGMLIVRRSGKIQEWNETERQWSPIMDDDSPLPEFARREIVKGPVYSRSRRQILFGKHRGMPGPGGRFRGAPRLSVATHDPTWDVKSKFELPGRTEWLFLNNQDQLIVVSGNGIYRLKDADSKKGEGKKFFGVEIPFSGKRAEELRLPGGIKISMGNAAAFERISTNELQISRPFTAAVDRKNNSLVMLSGRTLQLLKPDQRGRYQLTHRQELPEVPDGALAKTEKHTLVAAKDGRILLFSNEDLKLIEEMRFAIGNPPYQAAASEDGQWFALQFHNGETWTVEMTVSAGAYVPKPDRIAKNGTAIAFAGNDLVVANERWGVDKYSLPEGRVTKEFTPKLTTAQRIYHKFVYPAYWLLPKPNQLKKSVHYMVTDQDTAATGPDLRHHHVKLDVWGPIWSSLAFEGLMLALTCFYVSRKDL